jgi:hypothetical protein
MKYLIILGLFIYAIYKVGSFFFRAGAASQELKNFKHRDQSKSPKAGPKSKIKGGDYVDYEEVK